MKKSTEVLVIGGGVTGCGVLFDLAQRGFKCLLVGQGALAMGASGRFHGLLHSGGRYVVNDPNTGQRVHSGKRHSTQNYAPLHRRYRRQMGHLPDDGRAHG
jgi:glycerol-3-phosphate dehydrogenase